MARRKRLLAVLIVGLFSVVGSMQVNAGPLPIERQGPAYRDSAQDTARDTARPKWCKKKKNKDKKACQPKGGDGDGGNCDYAHYPDFCIAPYPPDLDCDQVNGNDFTVRGSDPHGFDGDNDGVGCES